MVEAVQDKWTGHQFVHKMIIMHEGPLKQLVHELAFLSSLRHTNMVHFYSVYMSPSNSEVKLMMELCEGKSLATIGEQIHGGRAAWERRSYVWSTGLEDEDGLETCD
ncbi:hypothetical protein F5148DRAFT_1154060 [Russula earlei]|uniref:Uncharacterized protein n=1 Tax=Russula earlei TaxID=71964 RepID=A0ACC0TT12_9AGAM|nr:hypothetical protein F5148DRAFT_1154060 [Russula earlei]